MASFLRTALIDTYIAVMTNSIECLFLLLAAGAIGAIFSSTSPEMGVAGLVERYMQTTPKILFLDTAVKYGGKSLNYEKKLADVAEKIHQLVPTLDKIVVVKGSVFQGTKM
jgi:acetoacetyl-CoA synthetase